MSVNAKLVIVSTLVLYTTPVRVLIVIAIDRMHMHVNKLACTLHANSCELSAINRFSILIICASVVSPTGVAGVGSCCCCCCPFDNLLFIP